MDKMKINLLCIAYKEGYKSGLNKFRHKIYLKNLYPQDSAECRAWNLGFMDGKNNQLEL